jgi:hypothetical protein
VAWGVADLDIPWPPRTDAHILPNVLTAMRSFAHIVVHEAATSDYAGYPGTETPLSLSGTEFLDTEPYGTGGGNPVVLATTASETQIGLAFPQGLVVRLFVGTTASCAGDTSPPTPDHPHLRIPTLIRNRGRHSHRAAARTAAKWSPGSAQRGHTARQCGVLFGFGNRHAV